MNVKMLAAVLGGLLIILKPQAVVHSLPLLLAGAVGLASLLMAFLIVQALNRVHCPHFHARAVST